MTDQFGVGPPGPVVSQSLISQHPTFSELPIVVKQELLKLPVEQQRIFLEEYIRKSRSTGVAYLCWLVGFQYAYVEKWGILAVYLLTFGGLLFWTMIDAFRIPGIVRDFNKDIAEKLLAETVMNRPVFVAAANAPVAVAAVETGAGDCVSCGAPISGIRGQTSICSYCDTPNQL